jgi:Sec-independent protein translocase protein TatA
MKTKLPQTGKSTIEQLRDIRDKISAETQNMNLEELQKYIQEKMTETLHPKVVWKK